MIGILLSLLKSILSVSKHNLNHVNKEVLSPHSQIFIVTFLPLHNTAGQHNTIRVQIPAEYIAGPNINHLKVEGLPVTSSGNSFRNSPHFMSKKLQSIEIVLSLSLSGYMIR